MGSEEAKEKAEFGRGKRKRGPSTKQREAAEATELDQQQEAAERKQRKKAPAKSAVEIAELSVGTVGSEFELNQWHRRQRVRAQTLRLNSAKQKANAPPEQTASLENDEAFSGAQFQGISSAPRLKSPATQPYSPGKQRNAHPCAPRIAPIPAAPHGAHPRTPNRA